MNAEFDFTFRIIDAFLEIAIFIGAMIGVLAIRNRLKKKQTKPLKLLAVLYTALAITPFALLFDSFLYPDTYSVQYGYVIFVISAAIMNIALLLFATEIFFVREEKPAKIRNLEIGFSAIQITVGLLAAVIKLQQGDITIYLGIQMMLAFLIDLALGLSAYRLATKIETEASKEEARSIRYIGHFSFSMILIYVFLIIDSTYDYYSVWSAIGLSLFLVAIYLGYTGFIKPMIAKND